MPIYVDGDFTVAVAQGKPRKSFPINGDNSSYLLEQDFVQYFANFSPLALDTAHPTFSAAKLVAEGPPQDMGGGVARWTRTYAVVPASRADYESFAWRLPGIAPGADNARVKLVPYASQTGTETILTTSTAHGLSVGDNVFIRYTVVINGYYEITRQVYRKVTLVSSSNVFRVLTILDSNSTPYYLDVQKVSVGRKPFTKVVKSKLQFDYFLGSPDSITIIQPSDITIIDENGQLTDTFSDLTTPTYSTYKAQVTAGTLIVIEPSILRRWKGNIYERVTRYAVAE